MLADVQWCLPLSNLLLILTWFGSHFCLLITITFSQDLSFLSISLPKSNSFLLFLVHFSLMAATRYSLFTYTYSYPFIISAYTSPSVFSILLIIIYTQCLRLERCSGKISYILSARELSIAWSHDRLSWTWIPVPQSRY